MALTKIEYNLKLYKLLKKGIIFDYTEDSRKANEIFVRESLNPIKLEELLLMAPLNLNQISNCWAKRIISGEYYNVFDNDSDHFVITIDNEVISFKIKENGYVETSESSKLKFLLRLPLDSIHITELYRLLKSYSLSYNIDMKQLTVIVELRKLNEELANTLGIKIDLPEKSSKQKVMTN